MDRRVSDGFERLREALAREAHVRVAYLFGSRAAGKAAPGSDWDVAALLAPHPDPWLALALADRLQSAVGESVDLVELDRAPVELAARVVTEGSLLYARTLADRIEFEARTLSLAHDLAPLLARIRREILEDRPHDRALERYRAALGAPRRLRDPA